MPLAVENLDSRSQRIVSAHCTDSRVLFTPPCQSIQASQGALPMACSSEILAIAHRNGLPTAKARITGYTFHHLKRSYVTRSWHIRIDFKDLNVASILVRAISNCDAPFSVKHVENFSLPQGLDLLKLHELQEQRGLNKPYIGYWFFRKLSG